MRKIFLLIYLISFFSFTLQLLAQKRSKNASISQRRGGQASSASSPFAQTQMWIGLKGGLNMGKANPTDRYSVFTSTVSTDENKVFEKQYDNFGKKGFQFGLILNFNFYKYFTISFQPEINSQNFGYQNHYTWAGQNNNSLDLIQKHRFQLSYIDLPLLVRFDIVRTRFRPYLQGGAFYSRLLKADKFVEVTSTDNASGAKNPISNTNPIVGAKDLFLKAQWGLIAGAGVNYDLGNVRLGLDAFYKIGMNNITNSSNRFSDDRTTSIGDVLDGMKLQNIEVSFSVIFPMKYLETGMFKGVRPK